jgi:DNA-binding transcriptional LysR family regulator
MLYPDGTETGVDDPPAAYGRPLGTDYLRTPYFLSAPLCVIGSDCVLCVPRRMAELVAAPGWVGRREISEGCSVTFCMIWHEHAEMDPGVNWVRA